MKHIRTIVIGFSLGFLLGFIMINAITGCQSWDPAYWTEYSSCITPNMIWDAIIYII